MCILQVKDHIQEVVAPEDSPLQQQETETHTIPDDARLVTRQLTLLTALLLRFRTTYRDTSDRQTDRQADRQVNRLAGSLHTFGVSFDGAG